MPEEKRLEFSFTPLVASKLPATEYVDIAKQFGLDGVDLRLGKNGDIELNPDPETIRSLKDYLKGSGIQLSAVMAYSHEDFLFEKESVAGNAEVLTQYLKTQEILGAQYVRIFSGKQSGKWWLETLGDSLNLALETSPTGTFLLQNHVQVSTNLEETARLLEQVNSPRFGVILSPDHSLVEKEDYLAFLDRYGDRVQALYVGDMREPIPTEDGVPTVPRLDPEIYARILSRIPASQAPVWLSFKWEHTYRKQDLCGWESSMPVYREFCQSLLKMN